MHFILHTDGGSRGNPGLSAIGGVLFTSDYKRVAHFSERVPDTTNNVAEYLALLKGIHIAKMHGATSVAIHMDSELIIRQLQGVYKIKAEHLKPYYAEAISALNDIQATFTHVPRENPYQSKADALVNQAMDASEAT
jgi:ribonuclease HI